MSLNRRALLIALAMAAAAVALLAFYMRRFEQDKSGGAMVSLLVTVERVDRGTTLTEKNLSTRKVPIAYVEDRAVKESERDRVIGMPLGTKLEPQQTLLWTDLALAPEDRDLSALVQPGKRAVTVPTPRNDNQLIRPGDYVDVVGIRTRNDDRARVLLQRVLVLAVGTNTGQLTKAPDTKRYDNITLSLTLMDAQTLALAQEDGKISVALRNPYDQRIIDGIPQVKAASLYAETAEKHPTYPNSAEANVAPTRIRRAP